MRQKRRELAFVFRQFAQILEDQARGFRRFVAFFLFLRIADQGTQLLTVSIWPQVQHFSYGVIPVVNQSVTNLLQLVEQRNLLVVAVFSLSSA